MLRSFDYGSNRIGEFVSARLACSRALFLLLNLASALRIHVLGSSRGDISYPSFSVIKSISTDNFNSVS
jgi:hypothetical protein